MFKGIFRGLVCTVIAVAIIFTTSTGDLAHAATKAERMQIIKTANKYLGTPYVFGARYGQTRTFDCSSFVKTVFAKYDVYLPRVSRDQAKRGKYVSKKNLIIGDLVFFTTSGSKGRIGHVGIYAGNGKMVHTYGAGGVKYTSIHKDYWKKRYVTARRVMK